MNRALRAAAMRLMKIVAVPLLGVVIGVTVALASSPNFLSRGNALYTPRPSPSPSPPSVTVSGVLGKSPQLVAVGAQALVGITTGRAMGSADGQTWGTLVPPDNASGIAMDPADPRRGITGGAAIQFTVDGGATWKPAVARPPAGGPYQVLGISPFDGKVWFFVHQGKLLVTRDTSATWRDIPGLPALSNPVLMAGATPGEFLLASGNRVFDLIDNAQQVGELVPALPGGVSVTALAVTGSTSPNLVARGTDGKLYTHDTKWVEAGGAPSGPIAAGATGVILIGNGGAKLGSPGGSIVYSNDGTKWSQAVGLPKDQSVEAIAGQPNSKTFFAYCYGGDVYTSTDSGRSWSLYTKALRATPS